MKSSFLMLGAALVTLAACDRGTDAGDANTSTAAAASNEAERYLAPFLTEDVDACFADVSLETPALEAAAGGLGISRPPARVVVLVDGSGSMGGRISGRTKLDLARAATTAFVDGLPATTEVSLLAFGQQGDNSTAGKPKSCAAVDTLVAATRDHAAIDKATAELLAVGWTPLAAGLAAAEQSLPDASAPGEQVIYVVSDGEETCGGDPVATARRINTGGRKAIVNIVGFGLPANEAATLTRVASAGGGSFVNVESESAARRTFDAIRESNRAIGNAVRTSSASTGNAVKTSAALTRASMCASKMVTQENARVGKDLSARAARGDPLPYRDDVQSLLRTRHDTIRAREQAFRARLSGANDRKQAEIDKAAKDVR